MLPEQTIAFRVYKNGATLLGVATVEMPQLTYITDTISGSGIAGEYEAPAMGMTSSMTAKLTWVSMTKDYFKLLDPSLGSLLEFRASIQRVDETTGLRIPQALRVSMIAHPKTASTGTLETGKKQGNETELEVMRLLVLLDGDEKILIDKTAFIHRVNGIDNLLKVRNDLGMDY